MRVKGPWTVQSSQSKYKNPWIDVVEDQVIRPDGRDGIFGVVTMKPGVSVLAMDENGDVYLTKEYQYAVEHASIEVVSGGVDAGESSLDAAKRELAEELGISADEWISLGTVDPFTSVVHSPADLYLARSIAFHAREQEGTETITPVKVSLEKAITMVMVSEITHGPSCVLILKAAHFLQKNKETLARSRV